MCVWKLASKNMQLCNYAILGEGYGLRTESIDQEWNGTEGAYFGCQTTAIVTSLQSLILSKTRRSSACQLSVLPQTQVKVTQS